MAQQLPLEDRSVPRIESPGLDVLQEDSVSAPEDPIVEQCDSPDGLIRYSTPLAGAAAAPCGEAYMDAVAGKCCSVCGGGSCGPPAWYTEQGTRVLMRTKPRRELLSFSLIDLGAVSFFRPEMSTNSMEFDLAAGYYGTLGHHLGRDTENNDHFIEFTYWGLNEWDTGCVVNATQQITWDNPSGVEDIVTGNLFTIFPQATGGFNRADVHSMEYRSDIHNFELNARIVPRGRPDRLVLYPNGRWRRECQPGMYCSWLFGLRGLSIDERFAFLSSGTITVGDTEGQVSGSYLSRTRNDMIGFQIGAEVMRRNCRWAYGAQVKAGPYLNFADAISSVRTDAAADPLATQELNFDRSVGDETVSFVGEINFIAQYKIRPHLTLKASYDLMWVSGLALAPEQLKLEINPPLCINTNGLIFYQGMTFLAEFAW